MVATDITLSEFLGFDTAHLPIEKVRELGESACVKRLFKRSSRMFPAAARQGAARGILEALEPALRIRLIDVLVGGWNKYQRIAKYADRSRYDRDSVAEVALAEHTITSVHEPRVRVSIDEVPIDEVRFEVELRMDFECVSLTIRDAKIVALSSGTCEGTGLLTCHGMLLAQASHEFKIPGTVSFDAGIPIAPGA